MNGAVDDAAGSVLAAMRGADPVAVTLAGGHLVERSGARRLFEPGRVVEERRNEQGRCTRLDVRYGDGSGLSFTWSPAIGHHYRHVPARRAA